jgi:two-component system cell cycle sensor histidine kinase/response regulator CckA
MRNPYDSGAARPGRSRHLAAEEGPRRSSLGRDTAALSGPSGPTGSRPAPDSEAHLREIVEDESSVRELARTILARLGYNVLAAADPREALAIVASHSERIHVLVSDVVMPVMSGPELARRIRLMRPNVKTLLLSGYTDNIIDSGDRLAGTDGFLSKPFTANDLARKVAEIIALPGEHGSGPVRRAAASRVAGSR